MEPVRVSLNVMPSATSVASYPCVCLNKSDVWCLCVLCVLKALGGMSWARALTPDLGIEETAPSAVFKQTGAEERAEHK